MLYVLPWGLLLFGPKEQNNNIPFNLPKTKAFNRIGPHNENILSIIVGSLLGDGWGEKRINSTRFHIHASAKNIEYIGWLQKLLNNQGYCSDKKFKFLKQIGKNNKIYYSIKIRTWSFSSWNYIYDEFYSSKIKIVPSYEFLITHLTPLALAIWIMDDGCKDSSGLRISTNCFKKQDILRLQKVQFDRYNLSCTIRNQKEQFIVYFQKKEMSLLISIIKPYLVPSMLYKINELNKI